MVASRTRSSSSLLLLKIMVLVGSMLWLLWLLSLTTTRNSAHVHAFVVQVPTTTAPLRFRHANQPSKKNILGSSSSSLFLSSPSLKEQDVIITTSTSQELVGDDSAYFSLEEQSLADWAKFSAATATVLAIVAWAWVLPGGPHYGDAFLDTTQNVLGTTDPAVTVFAMLSFFAVCHSGLAGLRTYAEPVVGARAWRVVFAVVSLPLALSCISYFVNHAHEGTQLWTIDRDSVAIHALLWITNFVSFLFLYPSTFNLLEIAAIEKPQLHLWESGIIRITRHPQAVGQLLWCLAHTLYLGTTTAVSASVMLLLHHAFACYHGDRRLETRHGEAFEYVKEKTSIVPFQAIIEGRQVLPDDYYKEFLRLPYAVIVGGTIAAYLAHPYMQAGAALLGW